LSHDAIVVGGGHNGLTCAGYLARAGLDTCVVERRDILGGACVTEEIWPGQRVSRASYVVSMLQPKVIADLELARFGYEAIALDPAFGTFAANGQPILIFNDSAATRRSIEPHSRKDAEAYEGFGRCSLRWLSSCARSCFARRPRWAPSGPATFSR